MKEVLTFLRRQTGRSVPKPPTADCGEVERAEWILYLNYLREGMTVFDVGANVGELTLLFSRFVADGRVHAFEAGSGAFKRLEAICGAAQRRSVVLNNVALSNQEGKVRLHVYDDPLSSFNSEAKRPMKDYGLDIEPIGVEEVPATTVDAYCEKHEIGAINLLKIDVEGAEFQVMQGAERMLTSKRVACLTFEFGQTTFDAGNKPEEIEYYLYKCGYRIRNIIEGDPAFPGRESVETARYSMHVAVPN